MVKVEKGKLNDVVCWWSGGITSAVACKMAIDIYGIDRCRFIFMDTKNEDLDTYRFFKDCSLWYGKDIERITALGDSFKRIEDVWRRFVSLNVSHGAICSSTLKRDLRVKWEKENDYTYQVFGFDISEVKRAVSMRLNHSHAGPIFPLLMFAYSKKDCLSLVEHQGIKVPRVYSLGFHNNNCFKTGCVQGGIGYWQKMKVEYPDKFDRMASIEHELTDVKGEPVTMLKDQSKEAKDSGYTLVFLKPHPDYPGYKDISMMKGRPVKPLVDCNGFCGTNDLMPRVSTELEINFSKDVQKKLF